LLGCCSIVHGLRFRANDEQIGDEVSCPLPTQLLRRLPLGLQKAPDLRHFDEVVQRVLADAPKPEQDVRV